MVEFKRMIISLLDGGLVGHLTMASAPSSGFKGKSVGTLQCFKRQLGDRY